MIPPKPFGPVPTPRQLAWHDLEMYGFVHFTINTFTDREWGYGDESPDLFNPVKLDCRQWARVAANAGLKGLILTAKHHDGFCLWPSAYTEHSVKNSTWKDGKGDVVQEFHDACQEFGLKMGLYMSPWDRNHAGYASPEYEEYYCNQLKELLNRYPGELFEVWFDGANGGDGYYGGARETRKIDNKTYYNFPHLFEIIRELQPNAVIFSDAGPDVRWCGNEIGRASVTCWNRMNPESVTIGGPADPNLLGKGDIDGSAYQGVETDVSICPGWFYHPKQLPRPLDELMEIYFGSVGRGCCLNLNLPPNREGLLTEEDVRRLYELRAALDGIFAYDMAQHKSVTASNTRGNDPQFAPTNLVDSNPDSYWAADDDVLTAELMIDLGAATRVACIRIEEQLEFGQRIAGFAIDALNGQQWIELAVGTTIGARQILRLPPITTTRIRVRITKSLACPVVRRVSVY